MTLVLRVRPASRRLNLRVYGPDRSILVEPQPPGPSRIIGVIGPPGPPNNGVPFRYLQASPSALWTVNHNRGFRPSGVTVLSPGGSEVTAEVVHLSDNQLTVSFAAPMAGSVII